MKKNLLLSGPIGCGKSTLIRSALGQAAAEAGGYVTLRILEGDFLAGFDLAPAAALADPSLKGQRFLDFTGGKRKNDLVFSQYGADLLHCALDAPFAVADEFGGLELLIPEFREALTALLNSPVPVIGVFKTPGASAALAQRLRLPEEYAAAYRQFRELLLQKEDTCIFSTTGRGDRQAETTIQRWMEQYITIY